MNINIEQFKKEISALEDTRKKYEHILIKAQTTYEAAVKTLAEKFNITPEHIDKVIAEKKEKLADLQNVLKKNIESTREYIQKIGKVIDDAQ